MLSASPVGGVRILRQRAMHTATDNAEELITKYTRLANWLGNYPGNHRNRGRGRLSASRLFDEGARKINQDSLCLVVTVGDDWLNTQI